MCTNPKHAALMNFYNLKTPACISVSSSQMQKHVTDALDPFPLIKKKKECPAFLEVSAELCPLRE